MTVGEILKLFRFVNGYDNIDSLAKQIGINPRTLAEKSRVFLSKEDIGLLADAFDVSSQSLYFSFRYLQDFDYNNREDRKKALLYILSLKSLKNLTRK